MSKKNAVTVEYIDANLGLIGREFTLELHGEGFQDLAEQFATKHNGRILGSDEEVGENSQLDPNKPAPQAADLNQSEDEEKPKAAKAVKKPKAAK